MPTIHHPITFREVRPDQFEAERDGKRIGSLSQNPAWAERHAKMWTAYPAGQKPVGPFRELEEAKEAFI